MCSSWRHEEQEVGQKKCSDMEMDGRMGGTGTLLLAASGPRAASSASAAASADSTSVPPLATTPDNARYSCAQ